MYEHYWITDDEKLLKILACPKCMGDLIDDREGKDGMICNNCKLIYPYYHTPILIIDEALPLDSR